MTGSHAVAALRDDRAFLAITGEETKTFLQGLLSQDVEKATDERAVFGALLTPQGKFLHDLFITTIDGGLALEGPATCPSTPGWAHRRRARGAGTARRTWLGWPGSSC